MNTEPSIDDLEVDGRRTIVQRAGGLADLSSVTDLGSWGDAHGFRGESDQHGHCPRCAAPGASGRGEYASTPRPALHGLHAA